MNNERRKILISAVSAEFALYREQICSDLSRPNLWLDTQETFPAFGDRALIELDNYIKQCDSVVQLVGQQNGSEVSERNLEAIFDRYPNIAEQLGVSEDFLRRLSYTQWEAWLASFHGRRLYLAEATPEALAEVAGNGADADGLDRVDQETHLAELEKRDHYLSPQLEFSNADRLVIALQKNLEALLVTDGLKESVHAVNRRFELITNTELINGSHIVRQEATKILESTTIGDGAGALLIAGPDLERAASLLRLLKALRSRRHRI